MCDTFFIFLYKSAMRSKILYFRMLSNKLYHRTILLSIIQKIALTPIRLQMNYIFEMIRY